MALPPECGYRRRTIALRLSLGCHLLRFLLRRWAEAKRQTIRKSLRPWKCVGMKDASPHESIFHSNFLLWTHSFGSETAGCCLDSPPKWTLRQLTILVIPPFFAPSLSSFAFRIDKTILSNCYPCVSIDWGVLETRINKNTSSKPSPQRHQSLLQALLNPAHLWTLRGAASLPLNLSTPQNLHFSLKMYNSTTNLHCSPTKSMFFLIYSY
jgi:hypothetical protein